MKKHISTFLFCCFLLSTGCSNNTLTLGDLVTVKNAFLLDEKLTNKHSEIKHTTYIDSIVANFARIYTIDSMLYAVDVATKKRLHIIDCKNNQYKGNYIDIGQGPDEVASLASITKGTKEGEFLVYDMNGRKWVSYNLQSILANKKHTNRITFKKGSYILNPHLISANKYIYSSGSQYKERFVISSIDGEEIQFFANDDLEFKPEYKDDLMSDLLSRRLSVKPDKSRLVLASGYIGLIEIYNTNGKLLKNIVYPTPSNRIDFEVSRSIERGAMIKNQRSKRIFLQVKTTDENIYILYSGREKGGEKNYSSGDIILVLDWDGNFISSMKSDVDLFDIAVYNKTIYAVTTDSNIVKFEM